MLILYRQLFAVLDRSERQRFSSVLVLATLMALVDLIGVAAVFPFLAVAAEPEAARKNALLAALWDWSGVTTAHGFLMLLGGLVLLFILGGMAVKLMGQYRIIRFAYGCNYTLSCRRLERYLSQPYVWYLSHNSAALSAAVLSECDRIVGYALIPALRILAQVILLSFLVCLLIAVNPTVAFLAAFGVLGTYSMIFLAARRRLTRFGQQQVTANAARFHVTQEAFGGIKEVKLMGLERHYVDHYEPAIQSFVDVEAKSQLIGELPRYFLEALAFGGLVLVILGLLVLQDARLADVLPTLGVFGFAVLKIFPAIQQIYNSMAQMRYAAPLLAKLHAEVLDESPPPMSLSFEVSPLTHTLELRDLHFSYPAAGRAALKGLSLTIKANTTVGIVGGTGAGKTTVVDLILGLLQPEFGQITVDGVPLVPQNMRAWQNTVGYVPQQIFLSDDSLAANIAFGVPPEARDMAAVERAARLAELHDFVSRDLPLGYDTEVGERGVRLSGGQRQRIGIARALYHDPSVLILDEATSALDNLTERAVMDAVANLAHAKTIIMIAHRLTTVRACDRIFFLENGKLMAQGTFDDLVKDNETFRRMAS